MISWNFHCFYLLVAKRYFRDLQISKNGKFRQFSKKNYFCSLANVLFNRDVFWQQHSAYREAQKCEEFSSLLAATSSAESAKWNENGGESNYKASKPWPRAREKQKQKASTPWSMVNDQGLALFVFAAVTVFSIFADTHQPTVLWWQQIADKTQSQML